MSVPLRTNKSWLQKTAYLPNSNSINKSKGGGTMKLLTIGSINMRKVNLLQIQKFTK